MNHLTTHKHREPNYLRAYKALHLSRGLYKSAHFILNKPNFQKAKMNITSFITVDYENIANWIIGENKPNQSQSNPISKTKKCVPLLNWSINKVCFSSHIRRPIFLPNLFFPVIITANGIGLRLRRKAEKMRTGVLEKT
ncbi:MAG: hypothetical protein ACYS30_16230 [Planctomycetota bacterium]|jgi:hypothetical protein